MGEFLLFFILFLGVMVLINIFTKDKVTKVIENEDFISKEENNVSIKQLESKLLRFEQRIKMRENSIISLKDQIKFLKDNSPHPLSTIIFFLYFCNE